MDFTVSEHVRDAVDTIHSFLRDELVPLEIEYGRRGFAGIEAALAEKREEVKAMGLWLPHLPKEHGGAGFSLTEFAHISEALGRSPLGHYAFGCQAPDAGNMEILLEHATEAQRERFLEPLLRGEIRSCFSMTEPDAPGSNPVWMNTTAVRDGDEWVINGRKWFTTSADGATFAVVMAVTNPDAESPYARASQILVPCDTPGFELVRNISVMGHSGEGWASHAEIVYDDVRVPVENLLGGEGAGFMIAQQRLGPGRIHHCMRWIGICERSYELMCERAATRELKPGKPLGTKQTIQNWIAESRAEIDAARLMVLKAAWRIDREGAYAARTDISTIKFFVAGVLQDVIDRAVQVHGALGMTDDTPLASFYRHERAARIYDGPDEVHKSSVARRELKRFGIEVKG